VPPILAGRNVLGAAQTGSGKTAAFLLPILQRLSEDPFGIFALVLTPTRELACQISEQVQAFGASLPVRQCTVIGGVDMTTQSNQLDRLPHVVVATPGRLADLLKGSRPPRLHKVRFLVFDEADRLFDRSFAPDLHVILTSLPDSSERQTLLFSATMDKNMTQMEALGGKDLYKWKATRNSVVVETLDQRYLFMPEQVRPAYLYKLMDKLGPLHDDEDPEDENNQTFDENGAFVPRMRSVIIFVQRCSDCQLVYETLLNLKFQAVALHSRLSQRRRLAALGKFKDSRCRILVATDVASRGLDIPDVDMVVNYDIPRSVEAYVHRVGRTARAGRGGTSVSMITQYDVELVKAIETSTGSQMAAFPHVDEDDVLPVLNRVSTAVRTAKLNMHQNGFDERLQKLRERGKKSRKRSSKFIAEARKRSSRKKGRVE
jgi:ATP-dependent RNA helicase DDX49/DBP8